MEGGNRCRGPRCARRRRTLDLAPKDGALCSRSRTRNAHPRRAAVPECLWRPDARPHGREHRRDSPRGSGGNVVPAHSVFRARASDSARPANRGRREPERRDPAPDCRLHQRRGDRLGTVRQDRHSDPDHRLDAGYATRQRSAHDDGHCLERVRAVVDHQRAGGPDTPARGEEPGSAGGDEIGLAHADHAVLRRAARVHRRYRARTGRESQRGSKALPDRNPGG